MAAVLRRSCNERAVRQQAAGVASGLIQRAVKPQQATKALQHLLSEHELQEWYNANWKNGVVRRIATEVALKDETTERNLASRLRAHSEIRPLLLGPRTSLLELHPSAPEDFDDPGLQKVYAAYQRLLFYHSTEVPELVRASGLDPTKGGGKEGYAATRSLAGLTADNVGGSKGRSYVTRSYTEAKQYAKDTGTIIRILIPREQRDKLHVDPDSQLGVYTEEPLLGVDLPDRRLGFWARIYLRKEIDDWGDWKSSSRIDEIYEELVQRRAFLPGKALAGHAV